MICILAAVSSVLICSAARSTDDDTVIAAVSDPTSRFYYPNMMLRYRDGKPLDDDEYFYLYYGYAFQDTYRPLNADSKMDRVKEILSRLAIDTPSVSDIDELIAAGNDALDFDPFSPQLLNIMAYAYGTAGDREREKTFAQHMAGIFKAIESSGDGLKEKSAMHILMFSHALDYIGAKGWDHLKARIVSREVEFVPFTVPHDRVKGYYFDYSRIYRNKPDGYVFRRDRTWQFNNLKPREYR